MAIELCSDNNSVGVTAPRISFSYDFGVSDDVPVDTTNISTIRSNSSIDFDFCVRKSYDFDQESSTADELFSNGKILPAEIKKRSSTKKCPMKPSADTESSKKDTDETEEKVHNTKSFWRFKRSSSLNCVSGYGRSLCPLPLLSRSNSTGSAPNNTVKRVPLVSNVPKQNTRSIGKQCSSNHQKPPLKKNYGNGVRVSPVLNVVPSGNLFGIFFNSNSKDKNRKK